ncbi:5'-nucleotidase domain-containing protein 3-like [Acanthaster planci]|uniref:5'-nucleotidase domain-containing protein 3-like n=1 Tax=Acanthaster planci TaxID=133434 RepID=A0A8B7Y4M1_ACAPL|nr:5'-nucleotidase domain-containing protein 3-like [Acanthaster planci]
MAAVLKHFTRRRFCIASTRHLRRFSCALGQRHMRQLCTSVTDDAVGKVITDSELWNEYNTTKAYCEQFATNHCINVEPKTVFANNEVDLSDIEVYGFDYDYTLACYTDHLHYLIYNQAVENLVERKMFPSGIANMEYSPHFAIRGLHFDTRKGYLMKIDAFQHIQLGTVYRGKQPVSDEEVSASYRGTHIPESLLTQGPMSHPIKQLMDLFAIPEMALLANVAEFLTENEIDYDPEYLFTDIHNAVKEVHTSGIMHKKVVGNVGKYLETGTGIPEYIKTLHDAGKQLFLMTNSQFNFVDEGMKFLLGPDWIDLFDVIITQARKPLFFHDTTRPFRFIYRKTGMPSWARVTKLRKGKIYLQGNMEQFKELTQWDPSTVLYFGDHVYSDLVDPCLKNGWRTGGVIPELDDEIAICNSVPFKQAVTWLVLLQELIQKHQVHTDPGCQAVVQEWLRERNQVRKTTKTLFNPQFGSIFRTFHNPSYFTSRLCRFADIYMSCLGNLNSYSLNHTFYPRRSALPHELSFSNVLQL